MFYMCFMWVSTLKTKDIMTLVSAVWPSDHRCDHKVGDRQYEYYHWLAEEVRCTLALDVVKSSRINCFNNHGWAGLEYRLYGVIQDVIFTHQPHFSCSFLSLICLSTNQNIQLIHSLLIRIEWIKGNGILMSSLHWPIYNKLYPDATI